MNRFLPLLVLSLAAVSSARAEPVSSAPSIPPEPLPESALRRFGTTRFRPGTNQNYMAFSPDGRYLASGGYTNRVHIWEVPSGREVRSLSLSYNQVNSLRFSPDGRLLAASSSDGIVRVWSAGDWIERTPPPPAQRTWEQAIFDWMPDSKSLVRIVRNGRLRIEEALTGKELQGWQVTPNLNVIAIACRPDGKLVVSQGYDHLLRAWDLTTGQEIKTFEVPNNASRVYRSHPRLYFSADGRLLAATENERTVLIWNADTGKIHRRLEVSGYFQSMAFAPNGRTVAVSAGDNSIRLWGVASGRELRVFDTPRESSTSLTFTPDGKQVVSSGAAAIRFWDIDADRELFVDRGHRGLVQGIAFLNGSGRLASIATDATLRLWDCASGDEVDRLSSLQYYYGGTLVATGDGRSVLFPTSATGLQRWTPGEGRMQYVGLSTGGGAVPALSPDGLSAVMVSGTNYRVYDVAKNRELQSIEAPDRMTNIHALSPGSRFLAAAHGYRDPFSAAQVTVYDIGSGRRWRPLVPPQAQVNPVQRLVFSPDTRFLAVVHSNGEVRVWELSTGLTRLFVPPDPQRPNEPAYRGVTSGTFTTDSRCLILGTATGQLFVCELDGGAPLRIDAHRAPINTLACSTDGERLASGSADTSILLWHLPDLRRKAGRQNRRTSTPTVDELEHAWNMLGTTDEKAIGEAIDLFAVRSDVTVPFLRAKVQPVRGATENEIAKWIGQLGDRNFASRESATRNLALAGENARISLVKALTDAALNPESRRRLEQLLRRLEDGLTPVKLQPLRAVEILERCHTADAREVLEHLATLTTDVVVKEEIDRALNRMKR